MLKKRIAANIVVRNGIVVQSIGFSKYLPVGKPNIAIEFLNQWGIDEIILLDISATRNSRGPNFQMIKAGAKKCFVPLTVGGGVNNIDQIAELMHCGADKISLNRAILTNPSFVTEAAKVFGNQCIIASIDVLNTEAGYRVYDYVNQKALNVKPAVFAAQVEALGVGEILLNSVDKDGFYSGFDIELIDEVCSALTIPLTCQGGAKNAIDFINVLDRTAASCASAANFFHFTEHSVNITKAIVNKEIPIRLESFADYSDNKFDQDLRLQKKSDKELEEMLFEKITKEII